MGWVIVWIVFKGEYNDEVNKTISKKCYEDCTRGQYSSQKKATVCSLCFTGSYSTPIRAFSNATCELCKEGKYSMITGATQCETCPSGF